MDNGDQIDEEWITVLSTTKNKKITQRGRYLEVR